MKASGTYRSGAPYDEPDAHLVGSDKVMARLVHELGPISPPVVAVPDDLLGALTAAVVRQQVSAAAAGAIFDRLLRYFGGRMPAAGELLHAGEDLRTTVGLSHAKERTLRALAGRVHDGVLDLDRLPRLPDEEVLQALTSVPGIGPWTAGVFMMFRLHRSDVMLSGDLGIRKGVEVAYRLGRLPSAKAVDEIAAAWRPYRSRSCLYLWAVPVAAPERRDPRPDRERGPARSE
ncbi:DNA-3-methyladenine glycosylase family protein [Streptacidiphilus anmyonensis]|uniref:DNA-3-methyladenine glycosylase family protein n=1 Tax=Streptacidiphilus anmyonensis TaxID=405782 RepID=UPI000693F344|nr:DNA-3-methyladenine glycosylase 2 family protein [Streptacidiphilus anmyonensis]